MHCDKMISMCNKITSDTYVYDKTYQYEVIDNLPNFYKSGNCPYIQVHRMLHFTPAASLMQLQSGDFFRQRQFVNSGGKLLGQLIRGKSTQYRIKMSLAFNQVQSRTSG